MKLFIQYFLLFLITNVFVIAQPNVENLFKRVTTSAEVEQFVQAVLQNKELKADSISFGPANKKVFCIYPSEVKKDALNVLVFAQQHGNEHSGKEGSLLILQDWQKGALTPILENINLFLIPQVNPYGSDNDKRRNYFNADLNRDHLVMEQLEVQFIHSIINNHNIESVMDVHEYYPYSEEWMETGVYKHFDEQVGIPTNPNINSEMRSFGKTEFLPFMEKYITASGFSFNEYVLGGPPAKYRMRYSTTDVNDGRQSAAIQGLFSCIVEGRNGKTSESDLETRSRGQYSAIKGFLSFLNLHHHKIKELNAIAQKEIQERTTVGVRFEHKSSGIPVNITLRSATSHTDTVVTVTNFHDISYITEQVSRVKGYLIPKSDVELVAWAERMGFSKNSNATSYKSEINTLERLTVDSVFTTGEEEADNIATKFSSKIITKDEITLENYIFVPTNSRKSDLLTIALEPGSLFGLIQYKKFSHLAQPGIYPVLRVKD